MHECLTEARSKKCFEIKWNLLTYLHRTRSFISQCHKIVYKLRNLRLGLLYSSLIATSQTLQAWNSRVHNSRILDFVTL